MYTSKAMVTEFDQEASEYHGDQGRIWIIRIFDHINELESVLLRETITLL